MRFYLEDLITVGGFSFLAGMAMTWAVFMVVYIRKVRLLDRMYAEYRELIEDMRTQRDQVMAKRLDKKP